MESHLRKRVCVTPLIWHFTLCVFNAIRSGGLESLFDYKKDHTINISSKDDDGNPASIKMLIQVLKRQIKPEHQDKFSK